MNFELTAYQQQLVDMARELALRHFKGFDLRSRADYPHHFLKVLAEHGLTGMALPEELGGRNLPLIDAVLVTEAMARVDPRAADCVHATNFGAVMQLAHLGDDFLRRTYLAPLLAGEGLITVAMTEPDAGSAVTELTTSARFEGDNVVIDGQKIFNTHGPHASHWVVWVRFGESRRGIGAVVVERGAPGLRVHTRRFMTGEPYGLLYFEGCRVPRHNVLVSEDGFKPLISVFNIERLGNAARALGAGQLAFDLAVAHAKERRQFGRRLCEFQGLQWKFAEMCLRLEGARMLLYRAAAAAGGGLPTAWETALAKLACNEAGFAVANEALQIHGGVGFDDDSPISYVFRRTRGWQIAGGTLEQLKNRIAEHVFGERFSQRRP